MINWANIEKEYSNFKNRNPTKWAFIEEFLDDNFYEKLYGKTKLFTSSPM